MVLHQANIDRTMESSTIVQLDGTTNDDFEVVHVISLLYDVNILSTCRLSCGNA
jgi:hypothetical protein